MDSLEFHLNFRVLHVAEQQRKCDHEDKRERVSKAQCKRIRSGFRNAKGTRNPMSTLSLSYLYQRSTDGAELESPQRRCVDEKAVGTSRKESLDTIH